MSAAISSALNSTVSTYTYTYQNKLQAKLDKNDDAVWGRDELQNYADSYAKATGKTLDVNALMEKYANEDGVIDYASQQQMKADDALGFSNLQALLDEASKTSSSSSSTGKSTDLASLTQSAKDAAVQAVNQFTYSYSGKLQPLLDQNDDGIWSKDELQAYANLYNKATGNTLDVDKLIEKYGNDDGVIDPNGQSAMKKADALDLAGLQAVYDSATAKTLADYYMKPYAAYTEDTTLKSKSSGGYSMEDLLSTMSPERKMAFSLRVNKYDNMANLLNQMTGGFSSQSSFNIYTMSTARSAATSYSSQTSLFSGSDTSSLYSAMSGQALNFTA